MFLERCRPSTALAIGKKSTQAERFMMLGSEIKHNSVHQPVTSKRAKLSHFSYLHNSMTCKWRYLSVPTDADTVEPPVSDHPKCKD